MERWWNTEDCLIQEGNQMEYVFTDEEMNYILELLVERPYRESARLIENIQSQYDAQKQEETES